MQQTQLPPKKNTKPCKNERPAASCDCGANGCLNFKSGLLTFPIEHNDDCNSLTSKSQAEAALYDPVPAAPARLTKQNLSPQKRNELVLKSAEMLWNDPSLKPSQCLKQLPKEYRSLGPSILLSASKVKERFGVAGSIDEDDQNDMSSLERLIKFTKENDFPREIAFDENGFVTAFCFHDSTFLPPDCAAASELNITTLTSDTTFGVFHSRGGLTKLDMINAIIPGKKVVCLGAQIFQLYSSLQLSLNHTNLLAPYYCLLAGCYTNQSK